MNVYLDNASTTRPCETAIEAAVACMSRNFGNPASLHRMGMEAEDIVSRARKEIATALVCDPACIAFTSGATEANNLILQGIGERCIQKGLKIAVCAVEHPSVTAVIKYLEQRISESEVTVTKILPGADHSITVDDIVNAVDEQTGLLSCMMVNNETGTIFPIKRAFDIIKRRFPNCIIHCDAVQGFLKIPFQIKELSVDCLSVSAHKVHGVKGCGAAYISKSIHIPPLILGGGQENNMRSGTEAVPMIAAFGAAVAYLRPLVSSYYDNALRLQQRLLLKLGSIPEVVTHIWEEQSPYILNFSIPGIPAEVMLHYLEEHNVYVSSGSACSKGKESEVLRTFGFSFRETQSALRVSFSKDTTWNDIDELVIWLQSGISKLSTRKKR